MKNRAQCRNCGDILESKHRHDMVTCTCFSASSAKLDDYSKKYVKPGTKFGSLHVEIDYDNLYKDPEYKNLQDNFRGFFLDGGSDYCRIGGNYKDIKWLLDEEEEE